MTCHHTDLLQLFLLKLLCSVNTTQSSNTMLFEFPDGLRISLEADGSVVFDGNTQSPIAELTMEFIDVVNCRVSTGWMSYNYLKSQYLLEGCKSEILEFLQPD